MKTREEKIREELESLTDYEIEEEYENMLNEVYEPVSICGYDYEQGTVLRRLDPVAFGCGVSEYLAEEFEEIVMKYQDDIEGTWYESEYYRKSEIEELEFDE